MITPTINDIDFLEQLQKLPLTARQEVLDFINEKVQEEECPKKVPEFGWGKDLIISYDNAPSENFAEYKREAIKGKSHLGGWEGKIRMSDDFIAPVVDMSEYKQEAEKKPREAMFDCLRGQICMADDFDAPLEDFAEYM